MLAWIECTVEAVHEAGDHYVVIGRVTAVGPLREDRLLLFYRGGYTATDPDAIPGSTALPAERWKPYSPGPATATGSESQLIGLVLVRQSVVIATCAAQSILTQLVADAPA